MLTVKEVSAISGASIRTLHYYDEIDLLKPTMLSDAGYRLYDETKLTKLQQILLLKEVELPLSEIKSLLASEDDISQVLAEQIKVLKLKKQKLENLIIFAERLKEKGVNFMDFAVFDNQKIKEYNQKAKQEWGDSKSYQEFLAKNNQRGLNQEFMLANDFMQIFKEFGELKQCEVNSAEVQAQVEKLQNYITDNYYNCSDEMLLGLSKMYVCDKRFKTNIDNAGGDGTAEFVNKAVESYSITKN